MNILRDFLIAGTPFRGLVAFGPYCFLAYVGVPQSHCLADMDTFEFPCHYGVTFRGTGDGGIRPSDWYWFGWDYGHCTDHIFLTGLKGGNRWTVEEVEADVIDAALSIQEFLEFSSNEAIETVHAIAIKRDPPPT